MYKVYTAHGQVIHFDTAEQADRFKAQTLLYIQKLVTQAMKEDDDE